MKIILALITIILFYLVYAKVTHVEEEPYTYEQYLEDYGDKTAQVITSQKEVILLSRPGCGYCTMAKDLLKKKKIKFTEYNIRTSKKGYSLYKKHKGSGVPLIIYGDEIIRGYNAQRISNLI